MRGFFYRILRHQHQLKNRTCSWMTWHAPKRCYTSQVLAVRFTWEWNRGHTCRRFVEPRTWHVIDKGSPRSKHISNRDESERDIICRRCLSSRRIFTLCKKYWPVKQFSVKLGSIQMPCMNWLYMQGSPITQPTTVPEKDSLGMDKMTSSPEFRTCSMVRVLSKSACWRRNKSNAA